MRSPEASDAADVDEPGFVFGPLHAVLVVGATIVLVVAVILGGVAWKNSKRSPDEILGTNSATSPEPTRPSAPITSVAPAPTASSSTPTTGPAWAADKSYIVLLDASYLGSPQGLVDEDYQDISLIDPDTGTEVAELKSPTGSLSPYAKIDGGSPHNGAIRTPASDALLKYTPDFTKMAVLVETTDDTVPGILTAQPGDWATLTTVLPVADPDDFEQKTYEAVSAAFKPGTSELWWVGKGEATFDDRGNSHHELLIYGPTTPGVPVQRIDIGGYTAEQALLHFDTTGNPVIEAGGYFYGPNGKLTAEPALTTYEVEDSDLPDSNRKVLEALRDRHGSEQVAFTTEPEGQRGSCDLWVAANPSATPRRLTSLSPCKEIIGFGRVG